MEGALWVTTCWTQEAAHHEGQGLLPSGLSGRGCCGWAEADAWALNAGQGLGLVSEGHGGLEEFYAGQAQNQIWAFKISLIPSVSRSLT